MRRAEAPSRDAILGPFMRMFVCRPMMSDVPTAGEVAELEASIHAAARLMKMLASEQRLLLLCRLFEGEASVGDLAKHAGLTQTAASQHLGKMRSEGLVTTRRDAQTIYYRLDNEAATRVLGTLCDIYRQPRAEP